MKDLVAMSIRLDRLEAKYWGTYGDCSQKEG